MDDGVAVKKSEMQVEISIKSDAVSPHPMSFYRPKRSSEIKMTCQLERLLLSFCDDIWYPLSLISKRQYKRQYNAVSVFLGAPDLYQ